MSAGRAGRSDATETDGAECGDGVVGRREECDDGNDVPGDGCEPVTCDYSCHMPFECGDGNGCTDDSCEPGGTGRICVHEAVADRACDDREPCTADDRCSSDGSCAGRTALCPCDADGDCVAFEDRDPCNGTLVCVPSLAGCRTDPATVRTVGASCDNGVFCDGVDTCRTGDGGGMICTHAGGACLPCQTCDETADACSLAAGFCLIEGVCRAVGEGPAGDPCRICDPTSDPTAWSAGPDGAPCDDASSCTTADACRGGICAGEASAEVCNGTDDDCDTATDEDFDCSLGETSGCTTTAGGEGRRACDPSCRWLPCRDLVCAGGWCWRNPLPQGNNLNDVRGSGPDDVWAVGDTGIILHWDGTEWSDRPSGTRENLRGVWAAAPDDAWSVGDSGTVLHWDGASWSSVDDPVLDRSYQEVWGTAGDDVWIGGRDRLQHWNGTGWSSAGIWVGFEGVAGIWGSGSADVWAATVDGRLFRWDGASWAEVSTPRPASFEELWGSGRDDVWAVGRTDDWDRMPGPLILHWDGSSWSVSHEEPGGARRGCMSVTGSARAMPGPVGRRALHWDGVAWTPVAGAPPEVANLFGLWTGGAADVWGVGRPDGPLGRRVLVAHEHRHDRIRDGGVLGRRPTTSGSPATTRCSAGTGTPGRGSTSTCPAWTSIPGRTSGGAARTTSGSSASARRSDGTVRPCRRRTPSAGARSSASGRGGPTTPGLWGWRAASATGREGTYTDRTGSPWTAGGA